MMTDTFTLSEAWHVGHEAHYEGHPLRENRFNAVTEPELYAAWESGWWTSARERRQFRNCPACGSLHRLDGHGRISAHTRGANLGAHDQTDRRPCRGSGQLVTEGITL